MFYFEKIIFVCGERIRKLVNIWKIDGIDPYDLKQIQKNSNKYIKDILKISGDNNNSNNNNKDANYLIANAFSSSCFSNRIIKKMEKYQVINKRLGNRIFEAQLINEII